MQGLTVSRLRQGLVGTMPPGTLPGRASVKGLVGTMPRANGAQKRLCDCLAIASRPLSGLSQAGTYQFGAARSGIG